MGVLAAVLADARQVAADVAGIHRGTIEGRSQQQDHACVAADQMRADRVHGAFVTSGRRRSREHRPGLRDGIDAALLVLRRAEGRAVVEVGAPVPVAVPGPVERRGQPAHLAPVTRQPCRVLAPLRQGKELLDHAPQEPAEPDALAAATDPNPIHPIVPVAGADPRQTV